MDKVSVLLPFYQARPTLNDAIASIADQTYTDWELILIDNNSTDGGTSVARDWCKKDPRIRLIHEARQGIARALNKGIPEATGTYLARMDADDLCLPSRLEKQVRFLKNNPDVQVVSCQSDFRSSIEKPEGYKVYVDWQNSILSPAAHFLNRFIESPVAHPAVMFHKKLVSLYGGYCTEDCPEDYELWLRWMEQGVRFAKIPEKLFIWHDSRERLSRTHSNYSGESFLNIKCHYMARWLKKNLPSTTDIVVCGTSKGCLQRVAVLEREGIKIFGLTDVRQRCIPGRRFIPVNELSVPGKYFIINFISKRGVNEAIRNFLTQNGYREGVDFLLAG